MPGPAQWLHEASLRWPQRSAIVDEEVAITFSALYSQSIQTAEWLHEKVKTGQRVIIGLPSSVTGSLLYFGSMYAGMVAVPIDPKLPLSQLSHMVTEIDPALIIGSPELEKKLDDERLCVVNHYHGFHELISTLKLTTESHLPELKRHPSALVNIVYTSGSTGVPKGVTLTNGNLEAVTRGISDVINITDNNTIFTALPFHHTYGLSQLWLMVKLGASLAVFPDITNMAAVKAMLMRYPVDVIAGVPYHFVLLTRRGEKHKIDSIKLVTLAGDAVPRGLIQKIRLSFPKTKINVMYGLTEASTRLTILPCGDIDDKVDSIGLPIEGIELRIVDESGNDLGAHQEGELLAKGANITLGYWKDEKLTKKKIIEGWLHTGDLVRKDNEGYFYFQGRNDFIFRSGGEKIVPFAIEEVLLGIDGVHDAFVFGLGDTFKGNSICAAIVKSAKADIEAKDIISVCNANLHPLWVPDEVVFLKEFPKISTGKPDYDALRQHMLRLRKVKDDIASQKANFS